LKRKRAVSLACYARTHKYSNTTATGYNLGNPGLLLYVVICQAFTPHFTRYCMCAQKKAFHQQQKQQSPYAKKDVKTN